jgi:hypothetical protein
MIRQMINFSGSFTHIHKTLFRLSVFVYWVLVALISTPLTAQIQGEDNDTGDENTIARLEHFFLERYGPDQNLYNGARYTNLHLQSDGHKFLGEDRYQYGKVIFDGRKYDSLQLKYDIYNQQVLLLFPKPDERSDELIINNLRLDEFHLGDKVFRKYYFPETDTLFFQVFEAKDLTILYHFRKDIINRATQRSMLVFTQSKRRGYLSIPSGLYKLGNNRSFAKLFPEYRTDLMAFMRGRKIKIRWASDIQIEWLLAYYNQLNNQSAGTP